MLDDILVPRFTSLDCLQLHKDCAFLTCSLDSHSCEASLSLELPEHSV